MLALVLQNREDEGFLYALTSPPNPLSDKERGTRPGPRERVCQFKKECVMDDDDDTGDADPGEDA